MIRRTVPFLFLAACSKPATPASAPAADTTTAAVAAAAPAPAPAADSAAPEQLRFASTIAGFRYNIPAAWGRRYTVSERADPEDFPKAKHVVEFMYLPDEGGVPPTMLTIADYDAADWGAVKGTTPGEVVAEHEGHVWVAIPAPKGTPLKKGSDDEKRFDAARVTPAQVKAAIELR
jgi:hypothetical protein